MLPQNKLRFIEPSIIFYYMDHFRIIDALLTCSLGGLGSVFWYVVSMKDKELRDIKKMLYDVQKHYVSRGDVLNFVTGLEHKVDKLDAKIERIFERILDGQIKQ